MRKSLPILTLCLLSCLYASAQSVVKYDQPEENTALFRGTLPTTYPMKYNGTFYWSGKQFLEGSVFYNGKLYEGVYLNVDAAQGQLHVSVEKDSAPIVVFRDQVAWFTMGRQKFLNLNYLGFADAPAGFFLLDRDGQVPLLTQVNKSLLVDGNNHNGREIGYYDPDYDPGVYAYFGTRVHRYAIENGAVKSVSSRAFRKMMKRDPGEPLIESMDIRWHPGTEVSPPLSFAAAALPGSGAGLPEGYFEEKRKDSLSVGQGGNAVLATYKNKVYTIGSAGLAKAGKNTVSGVVIEHETDDPMPGVLVYDDRTSTVVRTDARGRYKIQLPAGENVLNFSDETKEPLALKVNILSDGDFDVVLTEKVTALKAAVVSSESMANHRSAAMGIERIGVKTLNKIPSAFGEGDVMKAVLTLPGVKSSGEASSGFNVRGGSADQNLILFNENTIYNPSHMFGIFSSFNPDVVENVELFKSSIPARYGGRVSSVLNVKSKDGDFQKWKGSAGIGLMTSRLEVEGPLVKGKTSIVAGARTTYSDWILGMLPKSSEYSGGRADFTDANLGITHRFSPATTLQLYGYWSKDEFVFGRDTTFNYTSLNASAVLKHRTEDGGSYSLSGGYDHYDNLVAVYYWPAGAYDLSTAIGQMFLKGDFVKPLGDSHIFESGLNLLYYDLAPGTQRPYGDASLIIDRSLQPDRALDAALFVSDTWTVSDRFSIDGGVRASLFKSYRSDKPYICPEFRISGKYTLADNLSLKGGLNTMSQNIHLISNTSAISPMDTWKLSDEDIKPTTGWQAAAGIYWTHLDTGIDLSAETYYKQTVNHLDYKPGAVLVMNENLADDLVPVRSRSYGVELMAKKTTGKLTGWLSYSYSRALFREMEDRGALTIAHGDWYNAPYDKPHEFKLVSNYAFTHRYSLSVNVDYSTGRPVTVPIGSYQYGGSWRLAYSERNSHRIPDYFRTDVALNIDPGHYLRALVHATFTFGVYNVTGRKNPYSVYFDVNKSGAPVGHMLSVFAVPVPYANLNLLF